MAMSPQDVLAWYEKHFRSGGTPQSFLAAKLQRLDTIVADLKASPLAANIRVFGSAATQPGLVPGDIDVFFEGPYHIKGEERDAAVDQILLLAVRGGYHGNYGLLDPFRLIRPMSGKSPFLVTRSDDCAEFRVCWIKANESGAEQMIEVGRSGIPILDFDRKFGIEFADFVNPEPDEGALIFQP
jgi:hypothetical protein